MIHLIKDVFKYRELIELLTDREIKIRYKQSALGILWALLQPVIMVVLFTAIFTKIVKMPTGNIPYPIFFLAGLIPWTFFANSISAAIPSIVSNGDLVRKIYFPRVIFPLVSILACFFDFLISFILLVVLMVYFKIQITGWILLLPFICLVQLVFTIAVSLLFSSLNVFYRDVKNALTNIVQIWMFATPVIYPLETIRPHFRNILILNPMSGLIDSYRCVLIQGVAPNWFYLSVSITISLIIFLIAYIIFKRLEPNFSDSI